MLFGLNWLIIYTFNFFLSSSFYFTPASTSLCLELSLCFLLCFLCLPKSIFFPAFTSAVICSAFLIRLNFSGNERHRFIGCQVILSQKYSRAVFNNMHPHQIDQPHPTRQKITQNACPKPTIMLISSEPIRGRAPSFVENLGFPKHTQKNPDRMVPRPGTRMLRIKQK